MAILLFESASGQSPAESRGVSGRRRKGLFHLRIEDPPQAAAESFYLGSAMEKERRKEREFNLRRTEILEQAARIFAAKGFHSATVADIANASGFAIGTLYQFFESKEKLYAAVLTEKLGMMYAEVKKAVEKEERRVGKE